MTDERRWNEATLAETSVRRQHYVPQLYLRAFANAKEQIDVAHLEGGTSFTTSITNVAVETRLYDLDVGGVILSSETWLAEVEAGAAGIIRRLIDEPSELLGLADIEEMLLARFISSMLFRGPAFREMGERLETDIVSQTRDMTQRMLFNGALFKGISRANAQLIWDEWEQKPNAWWLGRKAPVPHAADVADMFSETQGWANLLRAKPWRIGAVADEMQFYTTDNPVAAHLSPVRPWWDHGGMASLDYFFPLSPHVLLRLGRLAHRKDANGQLEPKGPRVVRDFSRWETSVARHVVTRGASRFLLGKGPYITKSCAQSCLARVDDARLAVAMEYGGFDPRPPQIDLPKGTS